ncbi:hypothetical protein OCS_06068 [Ophiocordyceps sinensis CO18]|uniref:Uncharacterized protein n=1 Tax=Ophiocordyceps sinensis (strain Co18 / CGMCC 3.14243) TaxID=911162 RepID=T5A6K9_OPHSC|nr:hypothetical protein OCS_06068 [Ophiocordyceps sinensis CO18]
MPSKLVYGFRPEAFETWRLPDIDREFVRPEELEAFERALEAPDPLQTHAEEPVSVKSPRNGAGPHSRHITKRFSVAVGSFKDDASAVAAAARAVVGDSQPLQTLGSLTAGLKTQTGPAGQTPAGSKTYRPGPCRTKRSPRRQEPWWEPRSRCRLSDP